MISINIAKIIIKYILSFLKNDWEVTDYPLRYRIQKNLNEKFKWSIQIINWWTLGGLGRTKKDALDDLKNNFIEQVKQKGYKPRPGTNVPIEFASTESIDKNYNLLEGFLEKILGFKKESPVFISDLSSLWDFTADDTLEKYFKKIKIIYNKDVRNIEDGNISKILEAIKS